MRLSVLVSCLACSGLTFGSATPAGPALRKASPDAASSKFTSFVQIGDDTQPDAEGLAALTRFRQQHRKTMDGRLCAAAFVQDGQTYTDCTDARDPSGNSGREWCWVESQLKDTGARGWDYCAPVIDYDVVRARIRDAFVEKTGEVRKMVDKLNKEAVRVQKEIDIFNQVCGPEHQAVSSQLDKIDGLLAKGQHCLTQIDESHKKIETLKETIAHLERDIKDGGEDVSRDPANCEGLPGYEDEPFPDGLRASYYSGPNFSGGAVYRADSYVNFEWNAKDPIEGVPVQQFSVRWDGYLKAPATGQYEFSLDASSGARFFLNGQAIIVDRMPEAAPGDDASENPIPLLQTIPTTAAPTERKTVTLYGGQKYRIRIEAFHNSHLHWKNPDDARVRLFWKSDKIDKQVIPPEFFFKTNPTSPLKLSGYDPENFEFALIRPGENAFMGDDSYKIGDLPPRFENKKMLRSVPIPTYDTVKLHLNQPANIFIASAVGEPVPLGSCNEDTPVHWHQVAGASNEMTIRKAEPGNDVAVESRMFKIHYAAFRKPGDICLAVTQRTKPFILFFEQKKDDNEACGGEAVVLTQTSETYKRCESSTSASDQHGCDAALSGKHVDAPTGIWKTSSGGSGIGEWIRVHFARPVLLTQFRFKQLDDFTNRAAEVKLKFDDESDANSQVISLRSTNKLTDYALKRPQRTSFVTVEVTSMYVAGSETGGSLEFLGMACNDKPEDIKPSESKEVALKCGDSIEAVPEAMPLIPEKAFSFVCPKECYGEQADNGKHDVYGTKGVYTPSSDICLAAIHSGVCEAGEECRFHVVVTGKETSFASETANGITSRMHGPSDQTLYFQKVAPMLRVEPYFNMRVDAEIGNTWGAGTITAVKTTDDAKWVTIQFNDGRTTETAWPKGVAACGSKVTRDDCGSAEAKAWSYKVEFVSAGAPVSTADAHKDDGAAYSDKKGDEIAYGWATQAANSGCVKGLDFTEKNNWSIKVPSEGEYTVRVVLGSPCEPKQGARMNYLQVNGKPVEAAELKAGNFAWRTVTTKALGKEIKLTAECTAANKDTCANAKTTIMAVEIEQLNQQTA